MKIERVLLVGFELAGRRKRLIFQMRVMQTKDTEIGINLDDWCPEKTCMI